MTPRGCRAEAAWTLAVRLGVTAGSVAAAGMPAALLLGQTVGLAVLLTAAGLALLSAAPAIAYCRMTS